MCFGRSRILKSESEKSLRSNDAHGQMPTCELCGADQPAVFMRLSRYSLMECGACGLIFTADFDATATDYAGPEYFMTNGAYVGREAVFTKIFERLIRKTGRFEHGGNLLDIGTGIGTLLEAAHRAGYSAKGIELSPWAAEYAQRKGLDVVTGTLETVAFPSGSFDIVVLHHVLEHLEKPGATLRQVHRILKKRGLLVVGAPNAASLIARLLGPRWSGWRPEQHRWHFTTRTLGALLADCGFRVIHWEARENDAVEGWTPKAILTRCINMTSFLLGRGAGMLFFARKAETKEP